MGRPPVAWILAALALTGAAAGVPAPLAAVACAANAAALDDACARWVAEGASARVAALVAAGDDLVVVASSRGDVAARDPATGALAWERALGGAPAAVAIAAGSALVLDAQARLVALDAASGATRWETAAFPGFSFAYSGALAVAGGRVFVGGEGQRAGELDDALVAAIDLATGERAWGLALGRPGSEHDAARAIAASPDGATVYVAGSEGSHVRTRALDAATGALRWESLLEGSSALGAYPVRIAASSDRVIVLANDFALLRDVVLAAFDAQTGALAWTARHGTQALDDQGMDLALSRDGALAFVASTTRAGEEIQSFEWSLPAFVPTFDVRAHDAADGALAWSYAHAPGLAGAPYALATSSDGARVYAAGSLAPPGAPRQIALVGLSADAGAPTGSALLGAPDRHEFALGLDAHADGVFVTGYALEGAVPRGVAAGVDAIALG